MKSITVVIGSYKYGHLVGHAIESVLAQSKQPEKIIVVDDGIGDRTCDVARKYDLFCISRVSNLGVVDNYNDILYKYVKTDRVLFLGADDWLRPDALERLNKEKADIIAYDYAMVGGNIMRRKKHSTDYENGYYIMRFKQNMDNIVREMRRHNIIHGSALYNVEKAKAVGGYEPIRKSDKGRRLQEDWKLWRKMLESGATYIHIPEPFLYYRRHQFNFNGNY